MAWCWFAFGVIGVAQFAWTCLHDPKLWHETVATPIAASIPVLYFISVYANFTGHLSTAQAASAEVKIEEANDVDINSSDVDVRQK